MPCLRGFIASLPLLQALPNQQFASAQHSKGCVGIGRHVEDQTDRANKQDADFGAPEQPVILLPKLQGEYMSAYIPQPSPIKDLAKTMSDDLHAKDQRRV